MALPELLPIGAIINIHGTDGSSSGGQEYRGIDAFTGNAQRAPELVSESVDTGAELRTALSEIAWIDTLATPFGRHDLD